MCCQMQAINQPVTSKIAAPKTKFIQKPVAFAFGGKIIFNPIASTPAPRFISSSVRLSPNAKKLIQTATQKIKHLKFQNEITRSLKFQ